MTWSRNSQRIDDQLMLPSHLTLLAIFSNQFNFWFPLSQIIYGNESETKKKIELVENVETREKFQLQQFID